MTLTTATAYVALIFLLAGAVKGVVGLGLPTVAMGLLSLRMPPAEAAAILLLPSFITNVWQLAEGPRLGSLVRRLWPTLLAIFVSTALAASVIASAKSTIASVALGGALLLYATAGLFNFHMNVSTEAERWAGPTVGIATGFITGATGTFVIPAVPYLAGLGLARDELVQALGLSFTVSTVALGLGLLWHGALQFQSISHSTFAIVPALLGMLLGGRIRRRVSPERFRRWFFVGLGLLALHLIYAAL
ncbi:membrane protein [Steroidobacter agaridevorans]|uniref:Probable membrane transporter protein n=1 Tax=Steroidobacter agaridevorans TaxID=2695856 RepID=A0A829Y5V3_9GAMM|nr:sulfite exporter TauE/SafE family protein [Steroidobacter agaridevorans]GFE78604.1 membrane protein [Steroidobacter agaridevorans]GFE89463.1 membrane protein [Steroidobacter agaridevorans]